MSTMYARILFIIKNNTMSYLSYTKDFKTIDQIFNNTKEVGDHIMVITQHAMRGGESELSPAERELVATYVSLLNECKFCLGSHKAVAEKLGTSPETIQALKEDPLGSSIPKKMLPILEYTRKLTETPSSITQEDVNKILAAGWNEKTVENVIYIASLFAFFNRIADGFGLKGSEEIFKMGGEYLAENGYKSQ